MEDYPLSLIDFEKRFSTEEDCRDYLFQLRWPNGFICPRCNNQKAWPISTFHYECSNCNYQVSVIAGTIFHKTHKPLTIWFRVIWWFTGQKNGASALNLQRMLGLKSYSTAWTWLHKLRRAMVTPGRNLLYGIVEADETYIGGVKPGKRGRGAEGKVPVFIGAEVIETKIGRIRLQRIPDASASSLENAIERNIRIGSIIRTDDWNGYNNLNSIGYIHEVVRPTSELKENLLPSCNRVASLLKRWILGTLQGSVSEKHLDYYLDEFTFRFNRRTSTHRGKLFYRLLQNAVQIEPITFNQIVNKNI